ncbi:hypothetical protein ACFOWZ_13150 [Lentzea rhizosphaerae]|uniref:Flp pilus-assembly TadE/G-like n=1 Tax=Lentzea rhizosphaerae TaxID=2041025 RepID=A0ABV8BU08_9PSEU
MVIPRLGGGNAHDHLGEHVHGHRSLPCLNSLIRFSSIRSRHFRRRRKKRTGLIITIIFTALVLVGAGVAEALLIKKGERAISQGKQYSPMLTPIAQKTPAEVREAIGQGTGSRVRAHLTP